MAVKNHPFKKTMPQRRYSKLFSLPKLASTHTGTPYALECEIRERSVSPKFSRRNKLQVIRFTREYAECMYSRAFTIQTYSHLQKTR